MTDTDDEARRIAEGLNQRQRRAILASVEPWLASRFRLTMTDYSRDFYRCVASCFPDAKPDDSGRQFWKLRAMGHRVRSILTEQPDA